MSLMLNKIYIENFRSIRKLEIEPNYLSILVGKNDSGKSNILRALNLFFNNETNPGEKLDFSEDHNFYNNPNRRAQEITIRIELSLPDSYRKINGDIVCWEKRWRDTGIVSDKYWGYRNRVNRLGNISRDEIEIPSKSNLHAFLKKIEYRYIPAIKDKHYFESLRCQIYKTISEVATKTFRASSKSFEDSIGSHLAELTKDISGALGIDTKMALPRDLSHVFERLDFLGGDMQVSLDSRGDGIKAQHIPLILNFLANKKSTLSSRGTPPYTFIWGYEEPENNLEITSAIKLAERLWGYMYNDVAQIIVTTHSPVFYNLTERNTTDEDYVTCKYIYKDDDKSGSHLADDSDLLDDRMGAMELFSKKIEGIEKEIIKRIDDKKAAEDLARSTKSVIFVEGESDKLIFTRAIETFYPSYKDRISVETKNIGAGYTYVIDMLAAWHSIKKHHQDKPKAAGIVDRDTEAFSAAKDWNKFDGHIKSCKCFALPKPEHVKHALSKGYKADVTIESLYPKRIWEWHLDNGLLLENDIKEIIPGSFITGLLDGSVGRDSLFEGVEEIYIKYIFRDDKKVPVAERISKFDENKFKQDFPILGNFMRDIIEYLFPGELAQ